MHIESQSSSIILYILLRLWSTFKSCTGLIVSRCIAGHSQVDHITNFTFTMHFLRSLRVATLFWVNLHKFGYFSVSGCFIIIYEMNHYSTFLFTQQQQQEQHFHILIVNICVHTYVYSYRYARCVHVYV